MPADLLTTADVAKRCGVTPRTVARWANAGEITVAATAGDIRLFDPVEVERLAAKLAAKVEARLAHLKAAAS